MSIMRGMRRPNRSPSHPKMNAPTGRIISVRVMANVTCSMLLPNSYPTDEKTNVRRKKSSASSVHPRKQAMKVLRWVRLSAAATTSKLTLAGAAGCSQRHVPGSYSLPERSCWTQCVRLAPPLRSDLMRRRSSAGCSLVVVDPGARRRIALQRYGFHVAQIDARPGDG